jgi:hypothetical protein
VVIKVKGKRIRTSPFAFPLKTSNNHQKMADTVKTLLEFEKMTVRKRGTNRNSNTVVSYKEKQ